jgi:endonuclease/exonuclease/phosphatase family metal-dependent hydrolase
MTAFSVMTWNVENLFPPGFPISSTRAVTEEAYQAKLDYLDERIRAIQPDVLALQEIGSTSPDDTTSFTELGDRLQDLFPHRALSTHPDSRPGGGGIRVGFLSRLPIVATDEVVAFAPGELSQVPNFATDPPRPPVVSLSRGALSIDVEPADGIRVRLVTAHLKSKLITYPPAPNRNQPRFDTDDEDERARGTGLALLRRTAEVVAIRAHLNRAMQADSAPHVILLGDLNDEPSAATTQLLLGPIDSDVTSADRRDPVRLYNLCDEVPLRGSATKGFLAPGQRFSRLFEGRGELIDHILVSRGLLGTREQNRQDQWAVTEVQSLVDSIQGQSIGNNPAERVDESHPDHAPIVARFDL